MTAAEALSLQIAETVLAEIVRICNENESEHGRNPLSEENRKKLERRAARLLRDKYPSLFDPSFEGTLSSVPEKYRWTMTNKPYLPTKLGDQIEPGTVRVIVSHPYENGSGDLEWTGAGPTPKEAMIAALEAMLADVREKP